MGRKLDNVISLYLAGVVDGHVLPAADKYLVESFVDHLSPGGRDRFVAVYEPLVARYEDRYFQPLRGFEDGSRVFLHSYQSFGRGQVERVCMEIFDTDAEDTMTARWSVSVPVCRTRSGRSPIDGQSIVDEDAPTERNKRTVQRYVTDVLVDGRLERLGTYLDPAYAEHGADASDGLAGAARRIAAIATRGMPGRWRGLAMLVGRGDFVATLSEDAGRPVFDAFRVAAGRIVEHWDTR